MKTSIPINLDDCNQDSVSKISDTESRLSSMEEKFEWVQSSIKEFQLQAKTEANQQAKSLLIFLPC